MNTYSKISSLKPSGTVTISSLNGVSVKAERTADGKFVRIYRESKTGFEVISTQRF